MTKAGFLFGKSWLVPHLLFLGAALSPCSGSAPVLCFLTFHFRTASVLGATSTPEGSLIFS